MNEEIKWPITTNNTPLPELKRIHQMIWDYAIEHGEKPEAPYFSNCVACEYNRYSRAKCQDYPIVWPENDNETRKCTGEGGLYWKWCDAEGEEKTALAKEIRDLPWKFEVEES